VRNKWCLQRDCWISAEKKNIDFADGPVAAKADKIKRPSTGVLRGKGGARESRVEVTHIWRGRRCLACHTRTQGIWPGKAKLAVEARWDQYHARKKNLKNRKTEVSQCGSSRHPERRRRANPGDGRKKKKYLHEQAETWQSGHVFSLPKTGAPGARKAAAAVKALEGEECSKVKGRFRAELGPEEPRRLFSPC